MQLNETDFFDVCIEKWLRKYLFSVYAQFVYEFVSVFVANTRC